MSEHDDRVTPQIPRNELDEEAVPNAGQDMTGEGWSTGESGSVGGESSIAGVGREEDSLSSTTGRVDVEGRSVTGAIGNVGSDATTRGPDDQVDIEATDRAEAPADRTGSATGE